MPYSNFSFPLDLTMEPTTPDNQNAALANMFYWVNRYHDIMYLFGFNEASGNFQTSNFGGLGLGNDPVRAEAQDGGGTNNANFSTPADGNPGRMQMYLWTGGTPQRDGDFDQGIIIHELTHGLSTRLVRQLGGFQQMGEGWSDYFGIVLLASETDNLDGSYAVGQYATGNFTRGIRRFPYSTSTTVYPLMYADVATSVAPHGVGEVWCNTLLEVRAQLIRKLGFAEGQRQSLQLVVDGMKLSAPAPSFLDSRNSIMAADRANNAGANQCAMWTAFAKRGLGYSASSVGAVDRNPVQAFDLPPFCSDLGIVQLDQKSYLLGETVRIMLGDRNATGTIRAKVRSSITGDEEMVMLTPDAVSVGSYNSSLRVVTGAATAGDGQLQASLGARDKIIITYDDANNGNGTAVQITAQADVVGEKVVFDDTVEAGNAGWSVSGTPANSWAIIETVPASGTRSWTDSPNANYAAGTNASLVSPLFDLSRAVGVTLTFAHRYAFGTAGTDYGNVEFSTNDGATWNRATAFTGTLATFNQAVQKLDALAGQSRVRIRFRVSSVGTADGWTIDDIRLIARSSDPTFIPPPNALAPAITGITPASGLPAGNTVVTISGLNFTEAGDVRIFFNNTPGVNVRALGSTAIAVNTPAQPAGRASVRVETRYGTTTLLNAFTYYVNGSTVGAPDVTGIFPNSGSIRGGAQVTINGSNFSPETTVLFGAVTATRTFINSNTLRAIAPAATAAAAVDVTVRNSVTAEKKVIGGFTYTALTPPTVSVLSPAGGERVFTGSTVTLRWQSADNRRIARHRVALYRSTATTPQLIANIADLGGESKSFNWTIPSNAVTANGRLQIVAVDDEGAETTTLSGSDFIIESRWQTQTPLPAAINRLAATSDGKYIYQIGGRTNTGNASALTTVQRLEPAVATPAWEVLAPLPAPINSGRAVTINGKIYLPGGITPAVEIDRGQFVYDIAANAWSKLAIPPVSVHAYALAADPANNRYFMTGGSDLIGGITNAQVYNIQANTWTALPPMNSARFAHESAFVGGKLYVVGGVGPLTTGEVFDFTTQRWSLIAPMPNAHFYGTSALAQDASGKVLWLIIGGENNSGLVNTVDVYDFAADRWLPSDASLNLPTLRSRPGSAVLGGWVYAVGGNTGSTGTTTVVTNERFKLDGLTIISPNQPPLVIVPVTQQIALPGRELAFVVSAQDLGSGVPISITAEGLPAGANFTVANDTNNSARGTFRWTPAAADIGRNITVNFTASDGTLADVKIVQISVIQASPLTAVNAADFKVGPLAVDSIAAAFGVNLAPRIELAQSIPLPFGLADTMLTVNGIPAPLFFVSPTQINFVVPVGVDPGSATIIVTNPQGSYALGNIQIAATAPAIFTANASGTGDAAAQTTIDGINFQQPPFDVVVNGRPNILVLYATGVRRVPAANPNDGNGVAESVTVTIDGRAANVLYAGAQGSFAGLDQINVEFPTALAGQGARRVEVVVTVGGVTANRVTIQLK
ncbi:MAG: M36 family metallopeptidase [Acidobacteriota bacterium]